MDRFNRYTRYNGDFDGDDEFRDFLRPDAYNLRALKDARDVRDIRGDVTYDSALRNYYGNNPNYDEIMRRNRIYESLILGHHDYEGKEEEGTGMDFNDSLFENEEELINYHDNSNKGKEEEGTGGNFSEEEEDSDVYPFRKRYLNGEEDSDVEMRDSLNDSDEYWKNLVVRNARNGYTGKEEKDPIDYEKDFNFDDFDSDDDFYSDDDFDFAPDAPWVAIHDKNRQGSGADYM